jgi:hypothetical protein
LVVLYLGAVNRPTIYAYGGGQVVDATNDGGRHWWRAILGDVSMAVTPGAQSGLVSFSESQSGGGAGAVIHQYVSKDGGHHWRLSTKLGGL